MENASKALLIAGSVLVAVLLIALGMRLFNSGSTNVESAETTMTTAEISTYNNNFLRYMGSNKTKSEVINFLNFVIAFRGNDNSGRCVWIVAENADYTGGDIKEFLNKVITEHDEDSRYTLETYEYDDSGLLLRVKLIKTR